MTTSENGPASHDEEDDAPTAEERLNDAVVETSDKASGKDEDEVETDLRSAMSDRDLDPGDTGSLARDITRAAEAPH